MAASFPNYGNHYQTNSNFQLPLPDNRSAGTSILGLLREGATLNLGASAGAGAGATTQNPTERSFTPITAERNTYSVQFVPGHGVDVHRAGPGPGPATPGPGPVAASVAQGAGEPPAQKTAADELMEKELEKMFSRLSLEPKNSVIPNDQIRLATMVCFNELESNGYVEDRPFLTMYGNRVNRKYIELHIRNAMLAFKNAGFDFRNFFHTSSAIKENARINKEQFIEVMQASVWRKILTAHNATWDSILNCPLSNLHRLYYLACGGGKLGLNIIDIAQIFCWLGDPEIGYSAIPANEAIEHIYSYFGPGRQYSSNFYGLRYRKEIDASIKNGTFGNNTIYYLNEGRLSWEKEDKLLYFHRSVVSVNPMNFPCRHSYMWTYGFQTGAEGVRLGIMPTPIPIQYRYFGISLRQQEELQNMADSTNQFKDRGLKPMDESKE